MVYRFGGPNNKDYSTLGSILGSPYVQGVGDTGPFERTGMLGMQCGVARVPLQDLARGLFEQPLHIMFIYIYGAYIYIYGHVNFNHIFLPIFL